MIELSRTRIACYGWADPNAGSVAGAGAVVLRELIRMGAHVEFYANSKHVPRPPAVSSEAYVGLEPPILSRLGDRLPEPFRTLTMPFARSRWRSAYSSEVRKRDDYDVLLTLGTPPAFRIAGVRTVCWLQGPMNTELEAILHLKDVIKRICGRRMYFALVAYYRWREQWDRRLLEGCDHVILGSQWSRDSFNRQFGDISTSAIPYPVDLNRFRPDGEESDLNAPLVVCVGRLDPRKRIDLLLAAFRIVRLAIPSARLLVVGRPGYSTRYVELVVRAAESDPSIRYQPAVQQAALVPMLRRAAVLVQPSMNENFGSAVAEALACGTPVVVGSSNGTADYAPSTSRMFASYNPEDVAGAIVSVIDGRRAEPEFVANDSRAAAERHFASASVVRQVADLCVAGGAR